MHVGSVTTPMLQLVSSRNIIASTRGRIPVRSVISHSLDTITSGDTGLLTQGSHTSVSRVTIPAQQPVTSGNTG